MMPTKKYIFRVLILFTVVNIILISIFLAVRRGGYSATLWKKSKELIPLELNYFIKDSSEIKFSIAHQEYLNTLSKFAVPNYTNSRAFLDLGLPVGEIFKDHFPSSTQQKTKLILLWTTFYGEVQWMHTERLCQGLNHTCLVSTNKNDLLSSDAIVVHVNDGTSLPRQRLRHQRWIYYMLEPPYLIRQYTKKSFDTYNGAFNWTASYRWDSDIPFLYYNATKLADPLSDHEYKKVLENITLKKQKLAAIMHRNCHPSSSRFQILKQIRQFISVDFYGKCGNLSCPRNTEECTRTMSAYKFYLAFENSECRDYVTEKTAFPLAEWQAVPVVFGGHPQDYAKILPPDSYIHVNGFSSIQKLAEYLRLLDKYPKLYEKYHAWRKTYLPGYRFYELNGSSPQPSVEQFCSICKALFDPSRPVQSYRDFGGWNGQDSCR